MDDRIFELLQLLLDAALLNFNKFDVLFADFFVMKLIRLLTSFILIIKGLDHNLFDERFSD